MCIYHSWCACFSLSAFRWGVRRRSERRELSSTKGRLEASSDNGQAGDTTRNHSPDLDTHMHSKPHSTECPSSSIDSACSHPCALIQLLRLQVQPGQHHASPLCLSPTHTHSSSLA